MKRAVPDIHLALMVTAQESRLGKFPFLMEINTVLEISSVRSQSVSNDIEDYNTNKI